jgi:hypothetical protein
MLFKIEKLLNSYPKEFPMNTFNILPYCSEDLDRIYLKYRSTFSMTNFLICGGNYVTKSGKPLDVPYSNFKEAKRRRAVDYAICGYVEEQGYSTFNMYLSEFVSFKGGGLFDESVWVIRDLNFIPMTFENYKYSKRLF